MATLALSHPAAAAGASIQMEWWTTEPQGAEDKQLRRNAQNAVAHWKSRAEYLLAGDTTAEGYLSVPFEVVKKIRVTYRHVGALKPAPYPLDE